MITCCATLYVYALVLETDDAESDEERIRPAP